MAIEEIQENPGNSKSEKIKAIFELKSKKILNKLSKRKLLFMDAVATEAQTIFQELSKQDSNMTCAVSRQPITDEATYFIVAMAH